jgi:tetraacyldisaccharide 4'-kinase
MRAPAFWWDERPNAWARLLAPIGRVYGAITAQRMRRGGTNASVPVICVGNFIAGGAGKTPVALALGALLKDMGEQPAFLSRGYGGAHRGAPHRVDRVRDGAALVGDEPLLLASNAPTYICTDRVAGAAACVAAGASVILLDDGLQSPFLKKTLTLAVVDGRAGIGNGLCLPAGPLRAPLAEQWPHVDALVVVGDGAAGARLANAARAQSKPVFAASLVPNLAAASRLRGRRVFAFAGIGQPSKFHATLRSIGAEIVGTRAFADHHAYSASDILGVREDSVRLDAVPVTTEKDLVRIDDRAGIEVLPVTLEFSDPDALRALIAARIAR